MRFVVLVLSLTLALLSACAKSPEEVSASVARAEQSKGSNVALLAERKVSNACYVAVNLWYSEGDDSVATASAELANAVKDDWLLVSYNQEFNSRRTAIFKNKAC